MRAAPLCVAALVVLGVRPSLAQQRSGSAFAAAGTAALATYSGSILGLVGGVTPCGKVTAPATCSRVWVIAGGAVAGASGMLIGARDTAMARDIASGAAIGFGIGTLTGAALKPFVYRFTWLDVLALGLVGGAVGAAPRGAGLGLAGGAIAGSAAWALIPGAALDDAIAISLMGLALGGLSEWVIRAANAQDSTPETIPLASVRF